MYLIVDAMLVLAQALLSPAIFRSKVCEMHLQQAKRVNGLTDVTESGVEKRTSDRATDGRIKDLLSTWDAVRPDLDLSEFLLGIVVNRMGWMLEVAFYRTCRSKFGISGPDMRVLFALRRIGGPMRCGPPTCSARSS